MPRSFAVAPGHWPATVGASGYQGQRPLPPSVTWGHLSNPLVAVLTAAAADLVLEILGPVDYTEVGLIVRLGDGADAGFFALEPHHYPRGSRRFPLSVRLCFDRSIRFSAGALTRKQPKGYAVLRRHDRVLVGRLGRIDRP
jgi:hypothetical protein